MEGGDWRSEEEGGRSCTSSSSSIISGGAGAGIESGRMRIFSSVWEIEEEEDEEEEGIINSSNYSVPMLAIEEGKEEPFDGIHTGGGGGKGELDDHDAVYVAVGKSKSKSKSNSNYSSISHDPESSTSMDALVWALNHAVSPTTLVFLIHVFPELRSIPTPLGKLPISQVNPEQKESYMVQETSKRREFLQKFLDLCSASKVKVDTILIESDMEAEALLDLIPILNIRKLVLGTSKSSLRKLKSWRGNGIADQILQNAPEFCEVKIICEGKEVVFDDASDSASQRGNNNNVDSTSRSLPEENHTSESFSCACFKAKVSA